MLRYLCVWLLSIKCNAEQLVERNSRLLPDIATIEAEYKFEIEIYPSGTTPSWGNIVHFSSNNAGDCCQAGKRVPGIWFHGGSTKLYICSYVSGNGDFCKSSSPLPLNQWSSVTIQNKKINQDMYYTVTVNGVELHNGINKTPKSWSNVAVWASDNFYLGAKAMIKNAILTTGGYEYSLKKNAIQKSPIGGTDSSWFTVLSQKSIEKYPCPVGDLKCFWKSKTDPDNYVDFRSVPSSGPYDMKMEWSDGVVLTWTQNAHPLDPQFKDRDLKPTNVKISNDKSLSFGGLTLSSGPQTLLDGNPGGYWFFAGGVAHKWHLGKPAWLTSDMQYNMGDPDTEITRIQIKLPDEGMVTPVRNTKLSDAIDLLCPEYKLELEINPAGTTPQWGNVIHFTADNAHGGPGDCCNAGRRVPGIWFHGGNTRLHICSYANGNGNFCHNSGALEIGKWTAVTVENKLDNFKNMHYQIMVNGKMLYEGVNHTPESWKNVAVWISDNYYLAANANARNIALTTCGLKYNIKQTGIEKADQEIISCEHNVDSRHHTVVRLDCPAGKMINVVEALYGSWDESICRSTTRGVCNGQIDLLSNVKSACQDKQTCTFHGHNGLAGDPCHGIEKYTKISYNCVSDYKTISCEHDVDEVHDKLAKLDCPNGKVINVVEALYGSWDDQICRSTTRGLCSGHKNILSNAKATCQGKQTCTFHGHNGMAGDPCYGIEKYTKLTYDCVSAEEDEWRIVISNNYSPSEDVNVGKAGFNQLFSRSETKIVRRLCADCSSAPHREIYYKRLTPVPSGASMYDLFYTTWGSAGNLLNVDFGLFSSYEDAVSGKNPWKFCNYNDPDVGFPRDCGPSGHVSYQWNTAQGSRHWAKPGPEKYQFAINKVQAEQSLKWYNLNDYPGNENHAYGHAEPFCWSHGRELCTLDEYCPNGPLQEPVDGRRSGDMWAPYKEGSETNMWVQVGDWPNQEAICKPHHKTAGMGKPHWGNRPAAHITNWIACCKPAQCERMERVGAGCCRFNNIDVFDAQGGQTVEDCKSTCLKRDNCYGADTSQPLGPNKFECFHFLSNVAPPTQFGIGCGATDTCYKKTGGRCEFDLVRNTRVPEDILDLGEEYKFEIEIYPTGTTPSWGNIIHFSANNAGDCCTPGRRVPAMWFHGGTTKLYICSYVSGNGDYCPTSQPLKLNTWSGVTIENKRDVYGNMIYTVTVNGVVLKTMKNTTPQSWKNVAVWLSDNWYQSANAKVRNIAMTTNGITYNITPTGFNIV